MAWGQSEMSEGSGKTLTFPLLPQFGLGLVGLSFLYYAQVRWQSCSVLGRTVWVLRDLGGSSPRESPPCTEGTAIPLGSGGWREWLPQGSRINSSLPQVTTVETDEPLCIVAAEERLGAKYSCITKYGGF